MYFPDWRTRSKINNSLMLIFFGIAAQFTFTYLHFGKFRDLSAVELIVSHKFIFYSANCFYSPLLK